MLQSISVCCCPHLFASCTCRWSRLKRPCCPSVGLSLREPLILQNNRAMRGTVCKAWGIATRAATLVVSYAQRMQVSRASSRQGKASAAAPKRRKERILRQLALKPPPGSPWAKQPCLDGAELLVIQVGARSVCSWSVYASLCCMAVVLVSTQDVTVRRMQDRAASPASQGPRAPAQQLQAAQQLAPQPWNAGLVAQHPQVKDPVQQQHPFASFPGMCRSRLQCKFVCMHGIVTMSITVVLQGCTASQAPCLQFCSTHTKPAMPAPQHPMVQRKAAQCTFELARFSKRDRERDGETQCGSLTADQSDCTLSAIMTAGLGIHSCWPCSSALVRCSEP